MGVCDTPSYPAGCSPNDYVGKWGLTDRVFQGCTWIDTADMGGLVWIAHMGTGDVWYQSSNTNSEGAMFLWEAYLPS